MIVEAISNIKTIPKTLKIAKRWVLWRTEQRDGQATKVPKQPDGRNASTAASHTWTDFETAYKALLRGDFDGLGFVLGGGIVGVDLDHCLGERGEVAPWAADIVHRLSSYTEISPSGRGLHVLVRAELPQELLDTLPKTGIKKAIDGGGAIEIYWTGRYFTVTGNVFDGSSRSVETRTNELVELIRELSERSQQAVVTAGVHSEPSDDELIRQIRASEQGEKFCRLFYDGDLSEYEGDESRADLALCSILAYWTGGDREQIDRIFRRSRLYRAKWDELRGRDTYGAITIEKACSETPPPKKPVTVTTGEGVEVRREADYGHAQVLAQKLKGRLRYATHRGSWMLYDGKRWTPKTDNVISKLAADILFHQYLAELEQAKDKDQIRALTKALKDTTIASRIAGALYFLKGWPGFVTEPEEWDRDPWLLNVNNGTINLRTGEFRPHDPEDLITLVAPVDYIPSADCPRWRAHIERFLPDPDVRRQLQRDLGKSLVGAVLEESLPIWYGTGANGKSTTSRVVMSILGGYARRAAPDLLIQTKHDRHPTEIADLVGSRLVFSVEVDEAKKLAEVLVKELTGGDRKKARFMRQDFFEFEQTFSIFMIVNHKPIVTGTDEAIWRRIRLVPWTYRIPPEERRPQDEVLEELLAESSGILNWLLEGLKDWQRDRFWIAEAVRVATDEYRAEQDVLKPFLDECCVLCPHCSVPVADLYAAYLSWCERIGEPPITRANFKRKLTNRGVSSQKGAKGVRLYVGVRLKTQEKEQNQQQETERVAQGGAVSNNSRKNFLYRVSETTPPFATQNVKTISASSVEAQSPPDGGVDFSEPGLDKNNSDVLEEVLSLPVDAREKVTTPPSTEPMGVDALISELHRRGELSVHDMVLVKELKRGGSVGKAAFDVNANLGWTLPETTRRLERLKALGVVEETVDALGTKRWRLRA